MFPDTQCQCAQPAPFKSGQWNPPCYLCQKCGKNLTIKVESGAVLVRPAFRVTYDDGKHYVTDTAPGTTLAAFTAYITAAPHAYEVYDHARQDFVEKTRRVVRVEQVL